MDVKIYPEMQFRQKIDANRILILDIITSTDDYTHDIMKFPISSIVIL